jgi:Ni/Co efflux regulator RcnB
MKTRMIAQAMLAVALAASVPASAQDRSYDRAQERREDRREDRRDYRDNQRDARRDLYRGQRLPPTYHTRHYVVDNWRSHRLSAPPRGHHWVQVGNDYVLAAIATGIIANVLLGN